LLCDLGERGADAGKQRAQVYKLVRLAVGLHPIRGSDKRSSISRAIRRVCECMICKNWSCAFASFLAGPRSVSIKPEIEASGVRNSWLALAIKSARMRSIRRASLWSRNSMTKRLLFSPIGLEETR